MIGAPKRRAALAAPITALAIALSVAGCGGGGSSITTTASADTSQLQACLKQQGIPVPRGGAPSGTPPSGQPPSGGLPGGVNPQKMQKAFQACQQYAPDGVPSPSFPQQ